MAVDCPHIHYDSFRKQVSDLLEESQTTLECQSLMLLCKPLLDQAASGVDLDIKATVDACFKDALQKLIIDTNSSVASYDNLLKQAFQCATSDICSRSLPVYLLTDLFDCNTLSQCEHLFSMVENRVDSLKDPAFFKHVKNQLLRTCNDLLKRLSRSQNTVFCGRILVFLARFFPLFERSGLNLISEFNHDNVIAIALQEDGETLAESLTVNDLEEGEMPTTEIVQVDYHLYRKFWQLQEMFRTPTMCYNKSTWKLFHAFSNDVMTVFTQHKLDATISGSQTKPTANSVFFSKYLTNQKLLELQLSDSNFRRYILVQFLITFQYLTSAVRFKQDSQVLSDEQMDWVKIAVGKVYNLIEETPPNGTEMRFCIENILRREENWNAWKNDGCPELKASERAEVKPPAKRRKIGDEYRTTGKVSIGNPELSRLWNKCPDNWAACKSQDRVFIPSIEKFFEDVIHTSDLDRQMKLHDSHFSWRALRLLSQKSPHFFLPSNQMVKALNGYLESAVEKLSKDLAMEQNKGSADISIADAEDISDDELLKQGDDGADDIPQANVDDSTNGVEANGIDGDPTTVSSALLDSLAEKLGKDWKIVSADLFNFEDDEILYFETSSDDPIAQGRLMLTVWSEQDEPKKVTVAKLQNVIDKSGLSIKVVS